jgi:excisionase family DNA binding protein
MTALLTIGAAARRLGLSVDTVRALEQTGALEATRTAGGHRRFVPALLDAYLMRSGSHGTRAIEVPHEARPRAVPGALQSVKPRTPQARVSEPPKPRRARSTEPVKSMVDQIVETARLDALKAHGRSRISFDATAGARSAALEMLDAYVNASRFPASTSTWMAHQAIEAKIDAVLEPFNAAASRAASIKREEDAETAERVREERQLDSLIARGKSHAFTETLLRHRDEAEDARAAVLDALEEEVEGDWTNRDVEDLVDEVLEEFDEESDD